VPQIVSWQHAWLAERFRKRGKEIRLPAIASGCTVHRIPITKPIFLRSRANRLRDHGNGCRALPRANPFTSYLQAVRKKMTDTGALLILDEIQCGIGGQDHFLPSEQFGIIPDILTIAKAFGGGLPIGAFIANKRNMNSLTSNPCWPHHHFGGGNPFAAPAHWLS